MITYSDWKKMSFEEKHKLCSQHVPVTPEVFIKTAHDADDEADRKKYVSEYGHGLNVTFYADGEVHKDRPGVVGMMRSTPPKVPSPKEDPN